MFQELLQHYDHDIAVADEQLLHQQTDTNSSYILGKRAGLLYIRQCLDEAIDMAAERGNVCLILADLSSDLEMRAAIEQHRLEQLTQAKTQTEVLAGIQGYIHTLSDVAQELQFEVDAVTFPV